MNKSEKYRIRVSGLLSKNREKWFGNVTLSHTQDGETILTGELDQAALHGILVKIRDMGLKLIAVETHTPKPKT
jgi:hypothetical protein